MKQLFLAIACTLGLVFLANTALADSTDVNSTASSAPAAAVSPQYASASNSQKNTSKNKKHKKTAKGKKGQQETGGACLECINH